jgi:hypothetical protein
MGGSSKSQTTGYKYFVGIHMVLCAGPIDFILRILVDNDLLWVGKQGQGTIPLDMPNLFGGTSREGGITGNVDVCLGATTQTQNLYLGSQLGALLPAFRGVCAIVLNQLYLGLNPYLKPWSVRASRIHVRQNGIPQWYDQYSEIPSSTNLNLGLTTGPQIIQSAYITDEDANIETSGSANLFLPAPVGIGNYLLLCLSGDLGGPSDSSWTNISALELNGGSANNIWIKLANSTISPNIVITGYPGAGSAYTSGWLAEIGGSDVYNVVSANVNFNGTNDTFYTENLAVGPLPSLIITNFTSTFNNSSNSDNWSNATATTAGTSTIVNTNYGTSSFEGNTYVGCIVATADVVTNQIVNVTYSQNVLSANRNQFVSIVFTGQVINQLDMNPAHIIREALTDPDWGMGYAETDIDDVSFMTSAVTLYNEGLGCSKLWTDESTIEDFISEICQLANASVYVDRTTGLFVLKLIRNDYVVSDLITLGPSNIDNVTDFVQAKFGNLINQVIVQYWDAGANQTGTTTAQDLALIAEEGTTISQTNTYDGCTNITLASQLAQRDLQTLSTPLISCSIETNLASGAGILNIGSVFIWNWPDYKVSGVVMRATGIGYGDSKNNAILIKCVQDVFFELPPALVSNSGTKWSNSSGVALPVTQRLTFETPYLDIVQTVGQSTIDPILAANPEVSYVAVAGGKPTTGGISATFYDNIGAGFVEVATMQFCSVSALSVAVDPIIQTFVLTKTDNQFNEVVSGSWFQIDEEICVFQSIASDGVTISVLRGCLDTTPTAHVANSIVFFWDNYSTYDDTQLVASDVVETALCTVNGNAVLALAAAPVDTLAIVGRPAMPYPPGNVTVQATAFPSYLSPDGSPITLAWAHRDRTQQTTGLIVGYTEGNIGPETGVTYSTFIYGESGTLLHTETGLTTPNDSYSTELADSGLTIENSGGTSRYNNLLTIKIVSIRAGISCYQPYNWQVRRVGYGYSYGFYYGGLG